MQYFSLFGFVVFVAQIQLFKVPICYLAIFIIFFSFILSRNTDTICFEYFKYFLLCSPSFISYGKVCNLRRRFLCTFCNILHFFFVVTVRRAIIESLMLVHGFLSKLFYLLIIYWKAKRIIIISFHRIASGYLKRSHQYKTEPL